MSMDSKLHGVPLSTTQPTPSSAPKVSLSSSSSGIRAPPTVDSDFEYSLSTNGQKSSTSSCSSYSGFESEGFVSGEDEFESASERQFVVNLDDEILEVEDTHHYVDNYVFSRPFVTDPREEIIEQSAHVEEYGVSRPFVADTDDETITTSMEEEDEPPVVDNGVLRLPNPGMPIAQLSVDTDDDSVSSEVVDDDGFSGAIRVPSILVLENFNSAPKVKYSEDEVEETEEEESQCESVLETEVVEDSFSSEAVNGVLGSDEEEGIVEKDSVCDSDSAELVEDNRLDVAIEAKTKNLLARKECFAIENSELEDVKHSIEEIQGFEDMEHQTLLNERSDEDRDNAEFSDNADSVNDCTIQGNRVVEYEEDDGVGERDDVIASLVEEISSVTEYPVESKSLEADKDAGSTSEAELVVGEMRMDANVIEDVDSGCISKIRTAEVPRGNGDVVMRSDLKNCEPNLHDLEVDAREMEENVNFEEVSTDIRYCENNGVDVDGNVLLSQGSENKEEDVLHGKSNILKSVSLGSNLGPELQVETRDEAECNSIKLAHEKEDSFSDDDAEDLSFGISDTAKHIIGPLDHGLAPTSLSGGESSQDHLQRIEGPIVMDSDEEMDADGETEGREIIDSAVLAALLRAASGAGSDGSSVQFTSANGPRVFSFEHLAGLSSTFNSRRPTPQTSHPNIFTPELMARGESEEMLSVESKKKLEMIQQIRVKFLRLVHRLDLSLEDSTTAEVLYRLVLAAGRPSSKVFNLESAKKTAVELDTEGRNDLNFSLNILVIGKTGVGKSATINSIFDEEKALTHAFEPATTAVKEIVGTIDGVNVRILDTPGLISSSTEQSFNRKILSSIKKSMKKCPPDVVLYVDRLDTQTRDLNDLPLLRLITSSLGSSIWRNVIVTLTHAASTPPDGPYGFSISYEVFTAQRSRVVQQLISHVVGDLHMMNLGLTNPVSLVENHPLCQKNENGQRVLPNGESWRPQLLLLCYSMKILSEMNFVVKAPESLDQRKLFGSRIRSLPLPYFLSSLLQSNVHPKLSTDQSGGDNVDSDIELGCFSDSDKEDEDEYDELPPFKPLKKSQIAKLSKEQRKAYFEEYDYRVKLLRKKQWSEEVKRFREMKKKGKDGMNDYSYMEEETGSPATVAVPLPDMVLPPSFDGSNPTYRYRSLESTSQLLARPVLDLHGWDHDCGYDGVNLEETLAIDGQFPAVITVQLTKDKKEFNIHLDSSVSAKLGENGSTMAGLDIQTIGKQLAYIIKGETKMKNFRSNKTAAGVAVTFLGENVVTGLKMEDQIAVGRRLVLVGSTGAIRSQGDAAYGANFEVRFREKDFPMGQNQTALNLSLVKWRGDLIWGCNLQSQFNIGRSSKMSVGAGLNNKRSGQISVRTSSSDQLQIALIALLPIAKTIFRNIFPQLSEKNSTY